MYILLLYLLPFVYFANFSSLLFYTAFGFGSSIAYFKYSIAILCLPFLFEIITNKKTLSITVKDSLFLAFVITAAISILTFTSTAFDPKNLLQNLQVVYVFFVTYFAGASLAINRNERYTENITIKFLIDIYLIIFFVSAVFGLIEYLAGDYFWASFELQNYYKNVMGFENPFPQGKTTPGAWYSWDLYGILGFEVRRFVSFFIEPVGFGRFVALALIFLFWLRINAYISKAKFIFSVFISFLILILSINKGGLLLLILFFFAYYVGLKSTILLYTCLITLLLVLLFSGNASIFGPSVINHASSFFQLIGLINEHPMGFGLNINDVSIIKELSLVDHDYIEDKSEGGLALYGIFFGYFGVFLYFYIMYAIYKYTKLDASNIHFFSLLCFCVMLTGIFAHSAFSLVGSGIAFLILGFLVFRLSYEKSCN